MKKLIILGGNPETGVLVDVAVSMGVYTIVVDPNPNAPAKKNANESYDIDGFDVDEIVKLAKVLNVDGVLVGVADILVKPYWEICEKLNFPCYATQEAVEAFCSKDGFKKYCDDYNIQDIPGIYLDESSIDKPDNLDYPLMIKPVDSGGGVGMKICRDDKDYNDSVKTALKFSKKGVVLVEKYMDCDDMAAYYTFKDGVAYISAISDRITTKKQGDASPVCIGAVYPSKHSDLFIEQVHPKLGELFKGLKIKNGVLNIQFFVENGVVYAYDPGFRLQGEAPHIHIEKINGFDHRKMLVNFALTGVFGEDDFAEKNDFRYKGKVACTIWVLLTGGEIGSIKGIQKIKEDKDVTFVLERFKEGDTVKKDWLGTERQVYSRIYLSVDTIEEVNQKINEFKSYLQITDTHGEDMILEWLKPFNPKDY
ncbi:ATP-grasp domain-containing protein [Flagellimonas zhangzhouensis]|uniref:Biotin carboxylase n=1 Tax=Flagellimonas zhangzhouensis TaxID=1073328 RepID=A0A1H2YS43_9FLAO|nr:carbamoyl-phosphate-synthetase [Allomuricauda zhangzhouensis]SDR00493.1 Biotin carboxylase [Allomuricauda zhangzhouensis]SDX07339.1 Biotin carboxylase [Allomuricauda zhangzhouensis]